MSFLAVPGVISGRGAAWSPLDLSPEMWIRADLGHAYADTDPIAAIANQGTAGSAGDLAQSTSGSRPTLDASHASFNGQAVIDFVAASNHVLYSGDTDWWVSASESGSLTAIAIIRDTAATSAAYHDVLGTRQASTQGGLDLDARTGNSCRSRVWSASGAATITDAGGNCTTNSVHAIALVLTGAVTATPDSLETWVDGVSGGATTGDLAAAVAATADREFLVGGSATTTGGFTGQIAEIIYLKRVLTSGEDAALTAYLNDRYGLSLPGVTQ